MLIQSPAIGRRLQLGLNLEGPPPAPTVNPELQPVVIVDDLRNIDYQEPGYERPAGGWVLTGPAGAGIASFVGFYNPDGSGVIATVHGCMSFSPVAPAGLQKHLMFMATSHATPGGALVGTYRDGRYLRDQASNLSVCGLYGSTAAGVTSTLCEMGQREATNFDWSPMGPWTIPPGWMFGIFNQNTNEALHVSMSWTERVINPQGA